MESNKSDAKSYFIKPECPKSMPENETNSFTDMDLDVSESREYLNEMTPVLNATIPNAPDTVKNSNSANVHVIEAEFDETNTENDFNDANERQDGKLTCNECGEVVELLNNNATFSLEVHSQIHKVVSGPKDLLNPNTSYNKNSDYMCPDCNSVITVFNNDIDLSLQHHFSACQPKSEGAITPEVRIKMNRKFIDDVFYCLGDAFRIDIPYVVFEGGSLYCMACKCTVATSEDIFNDSISLHTHLSLLYHKDLVSSLQGSEQTLDCPEEPSKERAVSAQVYLNNSQFGNENHGGKQTKGELTKLSSMFNKMSLKDSESSKAVNNLSGNIAEQRKTTLEASHLFRNIPERYQIHQEFFSSSHKGIYCNICDYYVEPSETHLMSHIKNISHKIEFFNKIKEHINHEHKPHFKFMIIVDNKLFCSHCKVVVTSITSLKSVCEGAIEHFENYSHSD